MAYKINLISPLERTAIIKTRVEASVNSKDFYDFRNTKTPLPVIRISIDLPVYRMENFRTFTDQKEYITTEKAPESFFVKGQEIESIQQIQHEILSKLARKGKDKSITPVIDVLRKSKQQEPLLITANGVMVNGNRRLAAIRELSVENIPDFQYVEVMVLPADASADEILDIEASLQGKPETKLDYDWIGDAQLIKAQVNIHESTYNVSQRLNRTEKDIKNTLQALAEAELYLKEWAKAEDYSLVRDDAEQFFKDLPKNLDGKSAQLENVSRVIAWSLFDNRSKLPGRIYDFNIAFGRLAEDVIDRFSESLELSEDESSEEEDNGDDFAIDIEVEGSKEIYDIVIDTLKDKSNTDAVTSLIDASIDAIESDKGQRSGDAALKAVTQANSKLVSVDLSKANSSTFHSIKKQLESIAVITAKLQQTVDALINSPKNDVE